MTQIGTVTLEFSDTSTEVITHVNTRASSARYDRRAFRGPYGTTWQAEGSGKREPEEFTLSFEVHADTIEDASHLVQALLAKLEAAVSVSAPIGSFDSAGILSYAQSPIEAGYRLDVRMLAEAGRTA